MHLNAASFSMQLLRTCVHSMLTRPELPTWLVALMRACSHTQTVSSG